MKIHNLNEAIKSLSNESLLETLSGDYNQAWNIYLEHGTHLQRADRTLSESSYYLMTPLKARKAAYATYNIHNLWINNSPEWEGFPKRNIIMAGSEAIKERSGIKFAIFPKNNSVIGICPSHDIFNSFEELNKFVGEPEGIYYFYDMLSLFNDYIITAINKNFNVRLPIITKNNNYNAVIKYCRSIDMFLDKLSQLPRVQWDKLIKTQTEKSKVLVEFLYVFLHEDEYWDEFSDFMHSVGIVGLHDMHQISALLDQIKIYGLLQSFNEFFSPEDFEHMPIQEALHANISNSECWMNNSAILIPMFHLNMIENAYIQKYK